MGDSPKSAVPDVIAARPRIAALDFDGVVLESVDIKLAAFFDLFADQAASAAIRDYLVAHNGLSRYVKFRHIWTEMLGKPYGAKEEAELDARFSSMVLEKVLRCPFVAGAERFLAGAPWPLYVVSAMPRKELETILDLRGLRRRFRDFYGSPGLKREQLADILRREEIRPDEMLYIGDSSEDYRAAAAVSIPFLGRHNTDSFAGLPIRLFADLNGICDVLGIALL